MRMFVTCMFALLFALVSRSAMPQGMWDQIEQAIKSGETHRAFCEKNPSDNSCKPMSGSTLLFLCESTTPESLGSCHGALHAFALDGRELAAWTCVPKDTLQDFEQLRRLFIREGERMPEVLSRPARLLLYYAVAKAFPCPLRNIKPQAR